MHWPAPMTKSSEGPDRSLDWIDTWKSMEKLYKENPNKLKAIGIINLATLRWGEHLILSTGVSNFSVEFLERLLKVATVVPAVNQIELHPLVILPPGL